MPRPQPRLASNLRGFVCRSCLAELRSQKCPPRLSRGLASKNSPDPESKVERKQNSEPVFRFYEQGPDGRRKEIGDDGDFLGLRGKDPWLKHFEENLGMGEDAGKGESKDGFFSKVMGMIKPSKKESATGSENSLETISTDPSEMSAYLEQLDQDPEEVDPVEVPTKFSKSFRIPLSPFQKVLIQEDQQLHDYGPKIATFNEHLYRVWKEFPDILEGVSNEEIAKMCSRLWRSYVLCRRALLSAPYDVPPDVWWLLWEVFSSSGKWNKDRMPHIKVLADDINLSGNPLPDSAHLLYIEALFLSGDQEKALRLWELGENPYDQDSEVYKIYWELGVRMLSKNGQIDRAMEVVETLLGGSQEPDNARILLPLIRACLVSEDSLAVQKAWALYIRMRVILNDSMTMDDYDSIIGGLFDANQADLALRVFCDMMLTNEDFKRQEDSTTQYRSFVGADNDFAVARIEKRELTWVDSKALAALPKQFNNKYFFGKWMKKLIGDGELSLAEKVFHIMNQRGIRPDAKHLNGLIGAWLRTGSAQDQESAETMAWQMINARLDFVQQRKHRRTFEGPIRAIVSVPDKKDYKRVLGTVPNATIETLGLLVENYSRRVDNGRVTEIFEILDKAEIPPNTFFLNQVLGVNIRSPSRAWTWNNYQKLVHEKGVRPDFDTFSCLWSLMKRQTDRAFTRAGDSFTTCRTLFAEMLHWAPVLEQEEMPRDLYDLIVLSFGLADDQVGTAIALRALQSRFDMYPSPDTARSIVLQLSRVGRLNIAGFRPRRLKLDRESKRRVEKVTQVLAAFRDTRVQELAKHGIVYDEICGDEKLEESLMLLCDVLGYVATGRFDDTEVVNFKQVAKEAAREMGAPGCMPWKIIEDSG